MPLPTSITEAFETQKLSEVAAALAGFTPTTDANGAQVIADLLTAVDCVRYTPNGIEFVPGGETITAPEANEVLLLTTSVSLCGTDLDLIKKAQAGQLPPEAIGKIVGHEAAGFVVGVGSAVKEWQIGQFVCLDSHFACGRPGHAHFDSCVHSGESCDGIVGGIRGAMTETGSRQEPRHGYWTRVIKVPVSALPVPLPVPVAEHLVAPSTLESLGNIYMIIGQMQHVGLLANPQETILVVSGLGATGYPLAAVGTHYGCQVWGINPSAGKRELAEQVGVCQKTAATTTELVASMANAVASGQVKTVIIATMVGDEQALTDALAAMGAPELAKARRAVIVFGLYADAKKPMPGLPTGQTTPQRDFVFSRQSYTSPEGVEVYGVCGRDLEAWKTLMGDLTPQADGQPPALVSQLNQVVYTLPVADPLQTIAETLSQGPDAVHSLLKQHNAMKLAANLLKKGE